MKRATKDDWKTTPLPEQHVVLEVGRRFTEQEMILVRRGFYPKHMDERWFIYSIDDTVYVHRSWTGHCIFVAELKLNDEHTYAVERLLVNRDSNQYSESDPERSISLFLEVVENHLL